MVSDTASGLAVIQPAALSHTPIHLSLRPPLLIRDPPPSAKGATDHLPCALHRPLRLSVNRNATLVATSIQRVSTYSYLLG